MYLRKNFPIWRDAEKLLIEVELAVRNFPRYHKYSLGTELGRVDKSLDASTKKNPCVILHGAKRSCRIFKNNSNVG